MKKTFLFIPVLSLCMLSGWHAYAQNNVKADSLSAVIRDTAALKNDEAPAKNHIKNNDELLPRVCIDVNFKYGGIIPAQNPTLVPVTTSYLQALVPPSTNYTAKFQTGGITQAADIHVGYFFGKEHIVGVGLGFMYSSQTYKLTMDNFHVEYDDTVHDPNKQSYRQIITANGPITESITSTNISIPVLLKFKHQFKSDFGIWGDIGPMININLTNTFHANANINYEAAYDYVSNGHTVYDNGQTTSDTWLITQDQANHIGGGSATFTNNYFANLYEKGYNVGLNQNISSNTNSGTTQYSKIAYGGMIQCGISYKLSYRITANLGVFDIYQENKNSGNSNYKITDTVGGYNSMTKGITKMGINTVGGTIGLRIYLGKNEDIDGDGVPDKNDDCIFDYGLGGDFHGCPDSDGDGIPDKDDACPLEPGPACTNGCPDRDGDCVADKVDRCPDQFGSYRNDGCPVKRDRAAAGQADAVADGDEQPKQTGTYTLPHVVLAANAIYFKTADSTLDPSMSGVLKDVVKALTDNNKVIIAINGYTDKTGGYATNMKLSFARSRAVRKYLMDNGVDASRIDVSGYGNMYSSGDSAKEDLAKDRRIEMHLLLPVDK